MKKLLSLVIVSVLLLGATAHGGDTSAVFSAPAPTATSLFGSETQLNLGGSYRDIGSADYGVDFGVTHFLNETFGFGAHFSWLGDDGSNWNSTSADWNSTLELNAYYRYPIEDFALAPYAFGGLGVTLGGEINDFYQLGVGLDYRPQFLVDRVFVEAVQQWIPSRDSDTVVRAGFGWVF